MTEQDQEQVFTDIGVVVWLRLPWHGAGDLAMHDKLTELLGNRIIALLEHDEITAQLLEHHQASLYSEPTPTDR
jgi:uncharacterized heparinase superfamily protein